MGDFYGVPTLVIANDHLRLELLVEGGLRIVRLCLAGSDENQLAELPNSKCATPYGDYFLRGWHRLWHAPEAFPRSYIPDSGRLELEESSEGVRVSQPVEAGTGIRKSIEVSLKADRPALTVCHRLENDGLWPVTLAPWAITALRLGGVAILPQQLGPLDHDGLLPNRNLALWPYTQWRDSRLELYDDYMLIYGRPMLPPCKVGYINCRGWTGYLRKDGFFWKRFEPRPDQPHPDFGCNVEYYCNDLFLEMETLAPLHCVEPGQSVSHTEEWECCTDLDVPETIEGVRTLVNALHL